jgi:hypothetical protein
MDIKFAETNFKYVIFSMDCEGDTEKVLRLYNLFTEGGMKRPQPLVGCYDGTVEAAWITTTAALDAIGQSWQEHLIGDQESVLLVSGCNKQYAELLYLADGRREPLGSLTQVTREAAQQEDAWTYNPQTSQWFVCRHENPDREAPADKDARALWAAIDAVLESEPYSGELDLAMSALRKVRGTMKPKWL